MSSEMNRGMNREMDWRKLLSTHRLGTNKDDGADIRNAFVRDYDRLIFSSAFRRLQDKTQVFPLAKSDYVRTRLTHSLEVASVGRSLGLLAGEAICDGQPALRDVVDPHALGTIVSTACLAHDIGNPPFGHAGESAIQEWFSDERLDRMEEWGLTETERQDFLSFEGNAQGFRTLAATQMPERLGGMRLTNAVLATFAKYPRGSVLDKGIERSTLDQGARKPGASGKKFSYMQSEKNLFAQVAEDTGLLKKPGESAAWFRHPLAFLVEAADDICYHVMDIEDGFKVGALSFDELRELHEPWSSIDQRPTSSGSSGNTSVDQQSQAEYLRAKTINQLISEFVRAFKAHLPAMMRGEFDASLAEHIDYAAPFDAFKKTARQKVYHSKPVVEVEACGFEVISGLLSFFSGAVEDCATGAYKKRSETLIRLMPVDIETLRRCKPYERMLRVTDFVSSMTDSYAVALYQRIRGIALP